MKRKICFVLPEYARATHFQYVAEFVEGLAAEADIFLVVEKGEKRVYLVSGQTVMPREDGKDFDLLVVGSNAVPDGMSFSDTLAYGADRGLIQIAEHPFIESHRGMGRERLEEYIEKFDAIEGHNAQAIFGSFMSRLPVVGAVFSRAGRELNETAQSVANIYGVPYVANSDAHRIQDLGIAYNEWDGELNDAHEDRFLAELKAHIRSGKFKTFEGYEPAFSWFQWNSRFQKGIKKHGNKGPQEEYIPSNLLGK